MENYDPNQPVCNNQDDFNQAFRNALKDNNKQNMKNSKPWIYIYIGIYFIFFIWAILLAMQVKDNNSRILHILFASIFSPAYVLAYYLNAVSSDNKTLMGMCGNYN